MYDLSAVFRREIWTTEDIRTSDEILNFQEANFIATNAILQERVNNADSGTVIRIPFIQEEDYSEPSVGDDSDTEIEDSVLAIKKEDKAFVGLYAHSFSEAAAASIFGAGISLAEASLSLLGRYWKLDLQNRVYSMLVGIMESNIANEGGDLVKDASTEVFSRDLVIDTLGLVGDSSTGFNTVIAHSDITNRMSKNDDSPYVLDSKSALYVGTYGDSMRVIKNDIFAPAEGVYTTVFIKDGAFSFAIKDIEYPVETERSAKAGKGAGKTSVVSRNAFLIHPNGYKFNDENIASLSPTLAELQSPDTWVRNSSKKKSNFVFLKCRANPVAA